MYEWGVYFSLACQVRRQSVYFPATILFNKLKGWEPGKGVWTGCVLSICQINNRAWKQQILLIRQDGVLLPLKCYIALIFIFYSDTNYCKRFREWSKIKSCGIIHNVKIAWINLSAAPRRPPLAEEEQAERPRLRENSHQHPCSRPAQGGRWEDAGSRPARPAQAGKSLLRSLCFLFCKYKQPCSASLAGWW